MSKQDDTSAKARRKKTLSNTIHMSKQDDTSAKARRKKLCLDNAILISRENDA